MIVPELGEAGQRRLRGSRVLLVGCGALGSVIADQLVRAGIGELVIVDRDFVELGNLHRQSLFDESDAAAALPKAEAARRRLGAINRDVTITAHIADLRPTSAAALAEGCEVIVDGTDNYETRYLLNDLSVREGVPYVYGGVVGTSGAQLVVLPRTREGRSAWEQAGVAGPCLRCLWPELPQPGAAATCDTAGVLGPVVAMVASMQVLQAIKVLIGDWPAIGGALWSLEGWPGRVRRIDIAAAADDQCPCCAGRRFDFLDHGRGAAAVTLCGRGAVQIMPRGEVVEVEFEAIAARIAPHAEVRHDQHTLRASLPLGETHHELTLFRDGRAIVKGTDQPAVARTLYSRFVGL
jgi:adenylyltransferase/sulfurtransferase